MLHFDLEEEDFPDWKGGKQTQPKVGKELTPQQKIDVGNIFKEFEDILQSKPGRTNLTEHGIVTKSERPIRLPPYRIPHAYRMAVMEELEEMEPSRSEWSAPIVVVKKKDRNIRLCVDYRQLNSATPIDAYSMPRTDELIDKL